ncbi:hypothetical protein HanPSC8_Chr06g0255641 [Helianthus annuus]|nr:hypothetical protein HanPSC8_Chr06g0255641 [Helianthus annuus]
MWRGMHRLSASIIHHLRAASMERLANLIMEEEKVLKHQERKNVLNNPQNNTNMYTHHQQQQPMLVSEYPERPSTRLQLLYENWRLQIPDLMQI